MYVDETMFLVIVVQVRGLVALRYRGCALLGPGERFAFSAVAYSAAVCASLYWYRVDTLWLVRPQKSNLVPGFSSLTLVHRAVGRGSFSR